MIIKLLYDKETVSGRLRTGWGLSFLIGREVLFDTGEWGDWLLANMRAMRVDPAALKAVVISHDHWDHNGGLWDLLDNCPGLWVYAGAGFSRKFKQKVKKHGGQLRLVKPFMQIAPGVFTSGAIPFTYKGQRMTEQSLAIKTERGISVVTGCAHPGITAIIKKVKQQFPGRKLYAVVGGFHLLDATPDAAAATATKVFASGARIVAPLHCTGTQATAIFRKTDEKRFRLLAAGSRLEL
jgi:7,8-dihydropterin-6-yl-methyl-4-(beta-D-ribofuranosyl)aminobenzene 5'-phosphate synthase